MPMLLHGWEGHLHNLGSRAVSECDKCNAIGRRMQADAAYVTQKTGSEHAVRERCVNMLGAVQCLVRVIAFMTHESRVQMILYLVGPLHMLLMSGERKMAVT